MTPGLSPRATEPPPVGVVAQPFSVRRLRNLILVSLALGVALFTAVMFSLTQRLSHRFGPQVQADLAWRVQRGAQELAHAVDLGIAIGDADLVRKSFGIYARTKDVASIVAVDAKGALVARHGEPQSFDVFVGKPGELRTTETRIVSWAAVQIEGTTIGKVAVVGSTQRLRDAEALLARASRTTLTGGLAALLLGTVIVSFFTRAVAMRDARLSEYAETLERKVAERTAELEETHKQLMAASHRSGMAEIATNVLHNVGNVLNSVNVSATLVADNVKKSKISGLAKAVAVMREHAHDLGAFLASDPRGQKLPAYLAQLANHLTTEQEAILKELAFLRQHIDHIKEIVAMQQTFASASGVKEEVDLKELIEDGLRLNSGALLREGVELIRECEELPRVRLDKRKVLQILVNLISNAKHACNDSGRSDKRVVLRVAKVDDRINLTVSDNGVGIPPENLTRIFRHGFTTKVNGHGFGLHGGALAAKELGGALHVHSDGPGHGATFTLELPLELAS